MSSETPIPLPTEADKLSDIIRFYIDATRVEMWSMELTAEDNRYTRVSGKPRSGIASEPLLADLAEKRDFLSAALDRHPPEPEVVRAGLAQLREPLASALRGLEITSDRLRSGVAASVSFCDLHTAEMIKGNTTNLDTEQREGRAKRQTPIIDFNLLARQGELYTLPPDFLTAENLLKPNEKGVTALHDAAWFGHLDQVPDELLTVQNLSIQNGEGRTPFMDAEMNGHISQIPVEVRKVYFSKIMEPYRYRKEAPPLPDQSEGKPKT